MARFALIGNPLTHSYSVRMHAAFGYDYDLVPLEADQLEDFIRNPKYDAINVTIPYKTAVIPFLDELDPAATATGAVNTVKFENGRAVGYNTDLGGLSYLLKTAGIRLTGKKVVILGSGGTSKTAAALAAIEKARETVIVSRTGRINYDTLTPHADADILINTTPVGMYPKNGEKPVDLSLFPKLTAVVDAIYNPHRTALVLDAEARGIRVAGGLLMLAAQAKFARDIFLGTVAQESLITLAVNRVRKETCNIVLIGMPSAGKTTVGRLLARRLNRPFADTDAMIVRREGRNIPTIFSTLGEAYFREAEADASAVCGKETGQVIAVGGGTPLFREAYEQLLQNGLFVYLKRDMSALSRTGRPLLKDADALAKLAKERLPRYEKMADIIIENDADAQKVAQRVEEAFHAYFGD